MKAAMIVVVLLLLAVVVAMLLMARQSQTAPQLGLVDGQFQSCIYPTNCVNSRLEGESAIAPLRGDVHAIWQRLPEVITTMGGELQQQQGDYLWATFESRWLGFVDDLELVLDGDNQVIHLRAASRVGRSDFGVNRKRVEALRAQL